MKPEDTFRVLEAAASDFIPQDTNLFPRIAAAIEAKRKRKKIMQAKRKLAATIALVGLALIALTSAAYALYRLVSDPGLQLIKDAGLTTELNVTAQPSALPTQTPEDTAQPLPAGVYAQTLNGVTVTLEWILLDEGRLAFSYATNAPEAEFGAPQVTFLGATPAQQWGWSLRAYQEENKRGWTYVSYQVIHADERNGKAHLIIDIPPQNDGQTANTALSQSFHFDLNDIPIQRKQAIHLQQTHSATVNGIEMQLKSVSTTPQYTEAVVCYEFPKAEEFWYIQQATAQIDQGREVGYMNINNLTENSEDHCTRLGFGTGAKEELSHLNLKVQRLVVPLTMQDVLPEERIVAANQVLAARGIEIAPAPASESEGPGGWKFVRRPSNITDPSQDPTLLVGQALEEERTGPWEFYVDLPGSQPEALTAGGRPSPTAAPLEAHTIENVTVSLDWIFADQKRLAIQYTITGLPDTPEAQELNGLITLKDAEGTPIIADGGSSTVERAPGKAGVLTGQWSAVFREPIAPGEAQFSVDIELGGEANNSIAYFETPPDATPYPPGVFPPILPDRAIGNFHFEVRPHIYAMQSLKPAQVVESHGIAMRLEEVDITPSFTTVTLCYSKPGNSDWMIGQSTLKIGETTANNQGYRLLFDDEYGGYTGKGTPPADYAQLEGGRCASMEFYLGHANRAETVTLTVPHLEKSVPEVIPPADIQAAQEKLKSLGIEMDYRTMTSAGGGGGGGPVFKVKPEGMDDAQAYQKLLEVLGYIHAGPWVFAFDLMPES